MAKKSRLSMFGDNAEIYAYEPSLREKMAWAMADLFGSTRYGKQDIAGKVGDIADFVPGIGELFGADDAKRAYDAGNYTDAALNLGATALGAVPVVGDAASKAAKKGIRAYHATDKTFDKFEPGWRGATFFASTPERAKSGATAGAQDLSHLYASQAMPSSRGPLSVMEVEIPNEGIQGLHYTPDEVAWFNSLPDHLPNDDAFNEILKTRPSSIRYLDDVYDEVRTGERSFEYHKKKAPPSLSFEDAYTKGRDVYGTQHAHYSDQTDEKAVADRVRQRGMRGYLVNDEAGLSIAHISPEIIQIVKKYGIAAALGAGLITQQMADQMQAEGLGT